MSSMSGRGSVQRPVLNVFYVLDTSGSMQGESITVLNRAMDSTLDALRQEAEANSDAEVRVAVLEFSSGCRWVTPRGTESIDTIYWDPLNAGGLTHMGAALDELNAKLSRKADGFLRSTTGFLMPVIIFMTDGFPNDDYKSALARIRENKWFSRAARVGFAIGRNPDTHMIAELTGTSEAVIRTADLNLFADMLKWVSVTSSMLQSQSRATGSGGVGSTAVQQAAQNVGIDLNDITPDFHYQEEQIPDSFWGPDGFFADSDEFGGDAF